MYLKASRDFGSLSENHSSEIREPSKQDVRDFGESVIFGIADYVLYSSRGQKQTLISLINEFVYKL